jgi:isochorismate synthase
MSGILKYRLPETSETICLTGSFKPLETGGEAHGFVITDFLHQRTWRFEEGGSESRLFSANEEPVVITPRDYQIEAQAMMNAFEVCGVEKAVYSRVRSVPFRLENAEGLFLKLCAAYLQAFVYLVSSPEFGTWIGATPEVLVDSNGSKLQTMALAGTRRKGDATDWTQKEFEEHEYVAEAIASTLSRHNCEILKRNGPFESSAGPVTHLKTTFEAKLNGASAWQVAMDLHPTPAVCGTPRMAALDLITSREMHERSLYTGIIGLHGKDGTKLFVNLRCAQLQREKAFLYLGGGYTRDSIPDLEWEETENKARTLLDHME